MADTQARIVISADDKTRAAFESARRNLGSLEAGAAGLRAGLAGAAISAAAFAAAASVRDSLSVLDQLDDLAEKSGIAAEKLSALRYAGEVTGTPLEALATGTRKLAANMAAAAGGSRETAAAFASIGVAVSDANGDLRNSDKVLLDIADRFVQFEDGAAKSAKAQELFGKSGEALIPLLNQGSAGINRLRGEAQQLGLIYSGDLAKGAAEFNDQMRKIELATEALKVKLTEALLPYLREAADNFLEATREGYNFSKMLERVKRQQLELLGFSTAKTAADDIAALKEKIAVYENALKERPGHTARIERLEELRRELQAAEKGLLAAKTAASVREDASDALSRRLGRGEGRAKRSAPVTPKTEPKTESTSTLTADERTAQAVSKLLENSAVVKAKEFTDQLSLLDKLFFDLGLDAALYDSAVAALTRQTSSAEKVTSDWLEAQRELDTLIQSSSIGRMEKQRRQMQLLAQAYEEGRFGLVGSAEAMQTYGQIVNDTLGNMAQEVEKMKPLIEQIGEAFDASFTSAIRGGQGARGVLRALADQAYNVLLKELGTSIFGAIKPGLGRLLGSILPGRAIGGPVAAGQPYIVGERGRELFVPAVSGQIVPNSAMGGATIIDNRTIIVGDVASKSDVASMIQRSNQVQLAAIARSRTRDGALAD